MGLVIFGAGGFGPSVFDVANRIATGNKGHLRPVGFLDDDASKHSRAQRLGVPLLGTISSPPSDLAATHYAISISSPPRRREIAKQAQGMGLLPATLIHPGAWLCPDTDIADGAIICAGANIDSFVTIGEHAIINKNAIVGHDSRIGDFVTISPMSVIGGGSTVGSGVMIGMSATINPKLQIGDGTTVAAGAAVIRPVQANQLVAGVPAKTKKSVSTW